MESQHDALRVRNGSMLKANLIFKVYLLEEKQEMVVVLKFGSLPKMVVLFSGMELRTQRQQARNQND